jgi:hypothetical protein
MLILLGLPSIAMSQDMDDPTFQSILSHYGLSTNQLKKTKDYKRLPSYKKDALQESSFCFVDPDGKVQGNFPNELRNIASITKLFTTLLAMDYYGVDFKFTTRFHVIRTLVKMGDGRKAQRTYLYIEGGQDPTFDSSTLAALHRSLRNYGPIHQVIFDSKFIAYTLGPHDNPEATEYKAETKYALFTTFHVKSSPTELSVNDFVEQNLTDKQVVLSHDTYSRESLPLPQILKIMNVTSNNYIANTLYDSIPNPKSILERYDFSSDEVKLNNGSGYPINAYGLNRTSNAATCGSLLKLLNRLSQCLLDECVNLAEVIQQPCDRQGTLCNRFSNNIDLKQTIFAKTGTTNDVDALVGWIKKIPFVLLVSMIDRKSERDKKIQHANANGAIDKMTEHLFVTSGGCPDCDEQMISKYPNQRFSIQKLASSD